jgi:PAS domain S-box-containing protein
MMTEQAPGFVDTISKSSAQLQGLAAPGSLAVLWTIATLRALAAAAFFFLFLTLYRASVRRDIHISLRNLLGPSALLMFVCALAQAWVVFALWRPPALGSLLLSTVLAGAAVFAGSRLALLLPRVIGLGNPEGTAAAALVREVQERRRAEEELRKLNASLEARILERMHDAAYLATLVASSDDPIIGRDLEGTILSWNAGAKRLFGYEEPEALGHNVRMIFAPGTEEAEFEKAVRRPGQGEVLREYQTLRRCKDATVIPVSLSVSPVRDPEGRLIGSMSVYRDLRVMISAEAELQRQRDELARSNADLEQFAYVASHDLKAPLRAIANLARWLADDLGAHLRPQDRENLGLMTQRVARMTRMLDDLLAYSRAGRGIDAGEPVALPELLQEVWDSLGSPLGFVLDAQGLPTVKVDSTPFRLLLLNLVSNAIKHHDKGRGRIKVSAAVAGGRLSLCVEDDGPGIAPRDRERVFQMFQTLRPRDEVEGTGIGLALVKKLVERRGGRAWLDDAPIRGCRAWIEWPLEEENAAP